MYYVDKLGEIKFLSFTLIHDLKFTLKLNV